MDQLKAFFSGEEGLKRSDAFLKFASLLTEPKEEPKCAVVEEVVEEPEHDESREAIKIIKSLNSMWKRPRAIRPLPNLNLVLSAPQCGS